MTIALQLKEARLAAGLTQKGLAEKASLRVATICEIETGKQDPKVSTLKTLAKALSKQFIIS